MRFDVAIKTLDPEMGIIAPAREWGMTREEEMDYAAENGIAIDVTKKSPYSTDENIWGRSIECGAIEDPWAEPPLDAYAWTVESLRRAGRAGLRRDRVRARHPRRPRRRAAGGRRT